MTPEEIARVGVAIDAIKGIVKDGTKEKMKCPSCGEGMIVARFGRMAFIECETEGCTCAQLLIPQGQEWPVRKS